MLEATESEEVSPCGRYRDVKVRYMMSDVVLHELIVALTCGCDVILIPFPVMETWRTWKVDAGYTGADPFRVCRMADRITKTIYSDRFCV